MNLLPLVAGALVVVGGLGLLRSRAPASEALCEEPAFQPDCVVPGAPTDIAPPGAKPAVLRAEEACHDIGYLCADLERADRILLRRWKDFSGTMVIHVPRPDFEDAVDGARLQEAAARGIRAWNGQPFAVLTDLRGDRSPHFAVRWTRSLPGSQIGVARTRWSRDTGLSVLSIELTTRDPHDPGRLNDTRQVQLTAAHEMGHALGLPHSDNPRDVMYPSNTATAMSAQDYRTMEQLYALEDGTEIVR